MQAQLQEREVDYPAHNFRSIPLAANALMQHDHQTAVAVLILPAVQLDVPDYLPVEVDDGEEGRAVCDAFDAFGDFVPLWDYVSWPGAQDVVRGDGRGERIEIGIAEGAEGEAGLGEGGEGGGGDVHSVGMIFG